MRSCLCPWIISEQCFVRVASCSHFTWETRLLFKVANSFEAHIKQVLLQHAVKTQFHTGRGVEMDRLKTGASRQLQKLPFHEFVIEFFPCVTHTDFTVIL